MSEEEEEENKQTNNNTNMQQKFTRTMLSPGGERSKSDI